MAAAAGFEEDGPALRVHFGEAHKAPMVLLEAVAAALGDGAANGLYEESDVRQFLVPLRRVAPRAAAGAARPRDAGRPARRRAAARDCAAQSRCRSAKSDTGSARSARRRGRGDGA